jgi:hypothetical protein
MSFGNIVPRRTTERIKLDAGNDGIGRAVSIAEMRAAIRFSFGAVSLQDCATCGWVVLVAKHGEPTVKFHVTNVHTMDELRDGKLYEGSRLLTF